MNENFRLEPDVLGFFEVSTFPRPLRDCNNISAMA